MLLVVTTLLIPLVFSADVIEIITNKSDKTTWQWWWLIATDAVLLLVVLFITVTFYWRSRIAFHRIMLAWWTLGVGITLTLDWFETKKHSRFPIWGDLLISGGYTVGLTIILAATVGAHPLSLLLSRYRKRNPEAWLRYQVAIPLLFGTLAAFIGSTLWRALDLSTNRVRTDIKFSEREDNYLEFADYIEKETYINSLCGNVIDQEYFAQVSQIIPLLLVAVGLEAKFFARSMRETSSRALTINAVLVLLVGEVLALSALSSSGDGCKDTLQGWHEYAAFLATLEACVIALATLALTLLSRRDQEETKVIGDPKSEHPPTTGKPSSTKYKRSKSDDRLDNEIIAFGAGVIITLSAIVHVIRRNKRR